MHRENLELKHAEKLYGRLKEMGMTISEYSFANLYLFRNVHKYEVVFDEDIFIFGVSYDDEKYIMPTSDIRKMDINYLTGIMKEFGTLFPIPEEWIHIFNNDEFDFNYNEGDTDYIFTADKISTYKGKKLHKKRNLLYQFQNSYSHEGFQLTRERREDAVKILNEWQSEAAVSSEETDYTACMEALQYQDKLNLCGGIYYAENEPAGFILGEEINSEMFAIHFAKGLTKFKGIYQYMYNSCAQVLHAHYHFLNFEQDLDKIPLRKAKSSYIPDMMVKKFRITVKNPF